MTKIDSTYLMQNNTLNRNLVETRKLNNKELIFICSRVQIMHT